MSYSANEIQALAAKAARGADFPVDQSDRFGRAAVQHLAAGGDEEALLAALADPSDSPILRLPLLIDDVFAASAAIAGPVELTLHPGDAALVESYARLLPIELSEVTVVAREGTDRLRIAADLNAPATRKLPARIEMSDHLRAALTRLAVQTHVPASEASRLGGAGAGLSDND